MTPDMGWLALAVPVLAFALPMLVGAFLLETVLPWWRGER